MHLSFWSCIKCVVKEEKCVCVKLCYFSFGMEKGVDYRMCRQGCYSSSTTSAAVATDAIATVS